MFRWSCRESNPGLYLGICLLSCGFVPNPGTSASSTTQNVLRKDTAVRKDPRTGHRCEVKNRQHDARLRRWDGHIVTPGPADDLLRTELSEASPMKRVALASFVGSAIEYYDFYIYGTAAALVFPAVFFPNLGRAMATVASFATFAIAFISRPLGAAVFGYFGDRLGRKSTLVATLLIMGLSTVAVGLVPSAAAIGVAAPLILLTLRLLQGFAVGGEWAGAALLSAEYAPAAKRGAYGMFTQLGVGTGLLLTNVIFFGVHFTIGEKSSTFMNWGWRIPFLASALLVVVALYVRLSINETPVFADEKARKAIPKAPIAEVFSSQRRQIFLASGSVVGIFTFFYMAGTYLVNYAHVELGHPRNHVLLVGVLGGMSMIAFSAVSARLCDRLGRRPIMVSGFAVGVLWSFAVISLLDTGDPVLFALAIAVTYAIIGVSWGPVASFIPEIFATRYRYTGAGLSLNLGGIVGGALPPMIAGALLESFGSWAISLMLAILVLISLVCTCMLPETMGATLTDADKVNE
jgi:metabolite-proton symporter